MNATVLPFAELRFEPIFVYIGLGLSGLIALARLIIGWAMSD
jgi:hypothetical protein